MQKRKLGRSEIVYQAVPYVGMARVFDFLHATNEVLTERGVALPLPPQSTTTAETRFESGLAVQKRILGCSRKHRAFRLAAPSEARDRAALAPRKGQR